MCLVGSNDSEFDVQGFALALSIPTEEALAALPGFQRRAEAWQFGVSMLESDSATCQFFGAHTLQTKIAADWDTLDAAGQEALRGELIRLAVQHSTGAAHVVSKVNQALVTYAVRMSEAGRWRGVLAAAVEAIAAGAAAAGKSSGSAGRVIVDLVAQFPDEVQRTARGQAQRGAAVQEARDAAAAAVAMLAGVVGAGDGAVADYAAAVGQDAAWRVRAWRGILQWLHFGLAGDAAFERLLGGSLRALERLAARADSDSDEVAAAAAAVEDMVGNTRVAAQYARTVGGLALERLGAGWLGAAVQRCAAARDDEGAMAWASVAVAFGETYTELLLARLGSAPAQQIVQVMLAITAFPGTHGFDEGASDQPLNFWYLLQEAATDAGADAVAAVRPVFAQVVRAVVAKSAYPAAWARGGRDERERFGAFRREAADALLNAYYVLRDDMVDALAADAAHALAQATPDAWRDAEALLFALRSIGEAAGAGGCAALARLLSRDAIERLLQPVVAAGAGAWGLATLQSAVVALLGAYAEWWRAQDDALPAAVACVAAALALPATAAPAAAALRRICDACGEQLRGAAPALVRVACDALAAAVAPREQQRIVEAVAEVAAPALCVAPLAAAAVARLHASIAALEAAAPGAPAAVAASLRVVEALARGLQGDEDADADADADALRLAARVADSVAEPREALAALMARAVDVRVWPRDAGSGVADVDDAVAEALLGVVGATARRVPHALALDGVAFVAHAWDAAVARGSALGPRWADQSAPFLACATQLVPVAPDADALAALVARVVADVCAGLAASHASLPAAIEQQPVVCEAVFGLAERALAVRPAALPPCAAQRLACLAEHALAVPTRLALRPPAHFLAALARHAAAAAADPASAMPALWLQHGAACLRATLAAIGATHPRSLLPALAELLLAMLRHHPAPVRLWLLDLLAAPAFPSPHADADAKRLFAQQLLATRSLARVKAVVADFALKCRNMQGVDYAS